MFKALKIINSSDKSDLRFIAAGSYQIEFFSIGIQEFFTIYRMNYGSEGGAQYAVIEFGNSSVARMSENEFQIISGINTYKILVTSKNDQNKVFVTRSLWGWLPYARYGGKISSAGTSLLKAILSKYINGSVA